MCPRILQLTGDREVPEDVGLGGGHSYQGLETGAQLFRVPFAGWGRPNALTADSWILPLRFSVIEDGAVLSAGDVERGPGVDPGVTFMVVVPPPGPAGLVNVPSTAALIVL